MTPESRLRQRIEERATTVAALAKKAGIPQRNAARWVARVPDTVIGFARLCRALGVSVDAVLSDRPPLEPEPGDPHVTRMKMDDGTEVLIIRKR